MDRGQTDLEEEEDGERAEGIRMAKSHFLDLLMVTISGELGEAEAVRDWERERGGCRRELDRDFGQTSLPKSKPVITGPWAFRISGSAI